MATNLPSCFLIQFLEQLLKFLSNFTLLKYVKSQRNYGFLITKELTFSLQILDLKDHFSASLIANFGSSEGKCKKKQTRVREKVLLLVILFLSIPSCGSFAHQLTVLYGGKHVCSCSIKTLSYHVLLRDARLTSWKWEAIRFRLFKICYILLTIYQTVLQKCPYFLRVLRRGQVIMTNDTMFVYILDLSQSRE